MEPGTTMTIKRFALVGAALSAFLILSPVEAANKFYKWTDDAGVVHYGENPPDPASAQRINVKTGTSSDQEKAISDLEAQRAKAAADANAAAGNAEKSQLEAENEKIKKQNCEIYRQNLGTLKASARIREKDDKGQLRYLTDEEKAAKEKEAEDYLKQFCQ